MSARTFRELGQRGLSAFMKLLAAVNLSPSRRLSGRDQRSSIAHDGLDRTFIIHNPAFHDTPAPLPLVIALHGNGGNAESMILVTRRAFNDLADRDGFIVVYPDGIELNWNDGRMGEQPGDGAHAGRIDDVGFISALIDLMIRDHRVDPARVYVTGISNGATMAYRLACELSHRIAAIAPVDGGIPEMLLKVCWPSEPVSVLAINNVQDPIVPFEGGEIHAHSRRTSLGRVLSVNESIQFWAKRNRCSAQPLVRQEPDRDPRDGTRVTRMEYAAGAKGTEVVLYSVDGGGHTWPGGLQYLPVSIVGRTSRDIDASEVIWSFFKRHSRPAGSARGT